MSASALRSTSLVISTKKEFSFVVFHSANISLIRVIELEYTVHKIVCFGQYLHQPVFDAVMHHLYKMPGRTLPDMRRARLAANLGRGCLEKRLYLLVNFRFSADHYTRTVPRAFFTTRYPYAEKMDALLGEKSFAAFGIGKMGVSAVDHQVARLQVRQQIVDNRIHRVSRRHKHHDLARRFQTGDKIRQIIHTGYRQPVRFLP